MHTFLILFFSLNISSFLLSLYTIRYICCTDTTDNQKKRVSFFCHLSLIKKISHFKLVCIKLYICVWKSLINASDRSVGNVSLSEKSGNFAKSTISAYQRLVYRCQIRQVVDLAIYGMAQ